MKLIALLLLTSLSLCGNQLTGNQTMNPLNSHPIVRNTVKLQQYDQQVIQLVGIYKAHPVEVKMGRPPQHLGHAAIWVNNQVIMLGEDVRPADEREAFESKTVIVSGKLMLSPAKTAPDDVAQPDPQPALYPEGTVELYKE